MTNTAKATRPTCRYCGGPQTKGTGSLINGYHSTCESAGTISRLFAEQAARAVR